METMLVHGFIRKIEKLLADNQIIPLDIYHICFDFYFTTKILFYLCGLSDGEKAEDADIDIMCAANIDNEQKWKIEIQELDESHTPITIKDAETGNKWAIEYGGICFTRNLKLPPTIANEIGDRQSKFNNTIFRCGGGTVAEIADDYNTNYCAALIFNSHEFSQETNAISAYNWALPELPKALKMNFAVFSEKRKSLFSIGGQSNYCDLDLIYKLSFHENKLDDWKWTELETKLPTARGCSCASMIDKDNKIIIVGGNIAGVYSKRVDVLDLNSTKWIAGCERSKEAIDCGIHYDEMNELVYVGGGFNDGPVDIVECYDIEKDAWKVLPNTNNGHDMNPLIWIEDNNILHIMSITSNCIESMDLRESKQWNVKVADISAVFDTKFKDADDAESSRLVGN